MQNVISRVKKITKYFLIKIKRSISSILIPNNTRYQVHPWYYGFKMNGFFIPDTISGLPLDQINSSLDLSAPILFMARGHSGTRALTKLLEVSGVYMGNTQDKNSLNDTYDSLYWTFGFQRTLVPKLFKWETGCLINEPIVTTVGLECLQYHLSQYSGGHWGFKTCAGMFCHTLYRYLFPHAKYIYLVRDGRDVVLSGSGIFHLTGSEHGHPHWEYFKTITFGISNDLHACPFRFPEKKAKIEQLVQNKYWIQAKSWKEHVRMMEYLKQTDQLSPNVHMIRYEDLCYDPIPVIEDLFNFLELELTDAIRNYASQLFHTKSIGRWKEYQQSANNQEENIDMVFDFMKPELELLSYDK